MTGIIYHSPDPKEEEDAGKGGVSENSDSKPTEENL